MAPSQTTPRMVSRRHSCDRCHSQKLRCSRPGNNESGACTRCLRQGAQCVYSTALPKGRPSVYRISESPSTAAQAVPVTPTSPGSSPEQQLQNPFNAQHRSVDGNTNNIGKKNTKPSTTTMSNTKPNNDKNKRSSNQSNNINNSPNTNTSINTNVDSSNADTTMDMDTCTSIWPWMGSISWKDVQMDEKDSSLSTTVNENPQIDASGAFLDAFPCLLSCGATVNGEGHEGSTGSSCSSNIFEHVHGLGKDLSDSTTNSLVTIDKNAPDSGIAQLSQLSTQLYPLHRSSGALAKAVGVSSQSSEPHCSLIDDESFKCVASWLVHASANMTTSFQQDRHMEGLDTSTTTGNILHDTLSTSHQLLEVLHCLHIDRKTLGTSSSISSVSTTSSSSGGAQLDFWSNNRSSASQGSLSSTDDRSSFELGSVSFNYGQPSRQHSNTVIRHLVIACHTMLHEIYVAVLIALQHDADRRSARLQNGLFVGVTPLADIRLVMVVQVCSYLIERQHQAVDLHLAQNDHSASQLGRPSAGIGSNREARSEQKVELQQRLAQLRRTLNI